MPYIVAATDGDATLYAGPDDTITLDPAKARVYHHHAAATLRAVPLNRDAPGEGSWQVRSVD